MTRFFGFSIFTPKISDDPFLVIDQVFPFLFPDLPYLCYVKCRRPIYDPFGHSSQEKHIFYSVHTFARIRRHTTSQNIGETDAWAVPHLKFWGAGASIPPRPLAQIPPQSHRPSLFYGVRFQSMGKLQAPKARSCDCRRQEAPRD